MFSTRLLSLLLICGSIPAMAAEPEKVELSYRFQRGQKVKYEVSTSDRYEINIRGNLDEPASKQVSTKFYEVLEVLPNGSARLALTFESLKLDIVQNGDTLTYDSQEPSKVDPKLAQMAGMGAAFGIIGRPYLQVTISPKGQVSEIESLIGEKPDEISPTAREVLPELPDDPVAVGDSWDEEYEVPVRVSQEGELKRPIKIQRRYTLESIVDGIATIRQKTRILTSVSDPDQELQLLRRTPSGTIVLDLNEGLLVKREISHEKRVVGFGQGANALKFAQEHRETLIR